MENLFPQEIKRLHGVHRKLECSDGTGRLNDNQKLNERNYTKANNTELKTRESPVTVLEAPAS